MECKNYQRLVLNDVRSYLEHLTDTRSSDKAYTRHWHGKGIPVGVGPMGMGGMPLYTNALHGVPSVCLKVPTGGGKTFLACCCIAPVFDALPTAKTRAVVWLVPSDAILTQTLAALKNPAHPYRQRIDTAFGSRVEVYSKQELLGGQNFNITTVTEQLSIMVLSYDSFRGRGEGLKAYQENSNLAHFAKALGKPQQPIENADETALFQIINQLNPLVIVDESHHAKTTLSLEMLRNFNPCFVLELTATPRKESNIISCVNALQLKQEGMVKLPVVVYNRDTKEDVLRDAIDLRSRLEKIAAEEQAKTGRYIRPIVLFQAQPKGREDSTTYEKLREKLVAVGVPKKHIAIRTADVNELRGVDLLSPDCPVRYIITVNALKEGWDCPFAYILASIANRTSQVDVEQILGRILRLPQARDCGRPELNMSYVLTSSNDFDTTVKRIIAGLNSAGFSKDDCRLPDTTKQGALPFAPVDPQITGATDSSQTEEFLDFDEKALADSMTAHDSSTAADNLLLHAQKAGEAYAAQLAQQSGQGLFAPGVPDEVQAAIKGWGPKKAFADEARALRLPQFFHHVEPSLFAVQDEELLEKEHLADGFELKDKAATIDFAESEMELRYVDVRADDENLPKVFKLKLEDQKRFRDYFENLPPERRLRHCQEAIHRVLSQINGIPDPMLKMYADRVMSNMNEEQLRAIEKEPMEAARRIRTKIEEFMAAHAEKVFEQWKETDEIVCLPSWHFPPYISPLEHNGDLGKSLYEEEETMNTLERELVTNLTALPNIRWWHRNISTRSTEKRGFWINGFINHYPDIIIFTEKRTLIVVEAKGDHLKNDDSRQKVRMGRAWQDIANKMDAQPADRPSYIRNYRYYMVFKDTADGIDGAISMQDFMDIAKKL